MLKLRKASLDWALSHVLLMGDTDVFPVPFEYDAIKHDWQRLGPIIVAEDVLDRPVRPHRTTLSAKAKLGFRAVTQLDPLDFLVFAALISEVCEDIEARRVPVSANTVFSYRVKRTKDGALFDPSINYTQFVARSAELSHESGTTHLAITDIADFYGRIYHHRLQNALNAATTKSNQVSAIMNMLAGWNGTETFGIPIGSGPARLLAEATLIDVDEALLANQVKYARFNDDYRIAASSYEQAYKHLALLADILYRNHGLSLQKEKTTIVTTTEFSDRFLATPAVREIESLRDRFGAIVAELDLDGPYEPIDYDELDEDQQGLIDSLNLTELLKEEIASAEPEYPVVRFVVRRFAQLGDETAVDTLLDNLDILHPVFPDIVKYLGSLTTLNSSSSKKIGARLLDLLESSVISELAWHRLWALDVFTRSTRWNHADRFITLLAESREQFVRRKLILALGRAGQRHWFQSQWRTLFDEPPWPRRALLAAASCMPADARKHYYKSVDDRLDELERSVSRWARANPFA